MSTLTDDALERLLGETAAAYDVPADGADGVLAELVVVRTRTPLRGRRWAQAVAVAAVVAGAFAGGALLEAGGEQAESGQLTTAAGAPSPDEAAPAAEPELSGLLEDGGRATYDAGRPEIADFAGQGLADAPAALDARAPTAASAPDQLATAAQAPAAPAPAAPAPGAQDPAVQAPAPDGARVVKTGSLALLVADGEVTPTLTAVQELVTTAGGVVASAETQESGATPSGTVTLRVPVARFEEVVTAVRSLDAEVRSATTSGRDVTAEYTDVEAQLRTLRAARERFLEILGDTRAIGDVLAVQQRIDEVTGQIDRLEGARALLQAQSEMSTLTVTVTEADDPVVRADDQPDDGLAKAFRDAWDGFASGVEAIVAASGRALLLLLCLATAVVVLRVGWRIGRRRLV